MRPLASGMYSRVSSSVDQTTCATPRPPRRLRPCCAPARFRDPARSAPRSWSRRTRRARRPSRGRRSRGRRGRRRRPRRRRLASRRAAGESGLRVTARTRKRPRRIGQDGAREAAALRTGGAEDDDGRVCARHVGSVAWLHMATESADGPAPASAEGAIGGAAKSHGPPRRDVRPCGSGTRRPPGRGCPHRACRECSRRGASRCAGSGRKRVR